MLILGCNDTSVAYKSQCHGLFTVADMLDLDLNLDGNQSCRGYASSFGRSQLPDVAGQNRPERHDTPSSDHPTYGG